ncbi:MAG TPA: DUF4416 family protein [Gemmataceae bacterium]|nr:DUF4416 family protein [Gemmataceae bacterium]
MAAARNPAPVLLVMAAFSRHAQALAWASEELERSIGPIALCSIPFAFTQTSYYETSMGTELRKLFWAFRDLISPEALPEIKNQTIALEARLANQLTFPEPRPLNLDPGLLSLGKFMLATTKDQAHRLYLAQGIFAEVTLRYQGGQFEPWPWTYADYRQPLVNAFLLEARQYYRQRLRETVDPAL